jgi:acyl carrier protein
MDRDAVKAKLTDIFRKNFADDALNLNDTMTADDVKGWDSLTNINLILAVERGFNVRMSTREVRSLKNVGDLIALLEKKTA